MNRVLYVVHGRPARSGKHAENRTLRNSSSRVTNNLPISPHIS